jgi:urease accessory protein
MRERSAVRAGLTLVVALWPVAAFAHQAGGEAIGFLGGLKHPISGLDHVLAMIAVGLWGAQLGAPAIWLLPVTFPMVMAFGGMLALLGIPLPGAEIGIAVSAIALGLVVMAEARPPLWAAAVLVAFFAIFHGRAHGTGFRRGPTGCSTASDSSSPPALHATDRRRAGAPVARGAIAHASRVRSSPRGHVPQARSHETGCRWIALSLVSSPACRGAPMNTGFGPFYDELAHRWYRKTCRRRDGAPGRARRLARGRFALFVTHGQKSASPPAAVSPQGRRSG